MKKQLRPLAITASIMVLLAVGYLLLRLLVPDLLTPDKNDTSNFEVTGYALSELDHVAFDFADGYRYTVQLTHVSASNRTIAVVGKENYPFDSTSLSSAVATLGSITASRSYEDVTDLAEYGLDNPQAVVEVGGTDGTSVTLLVGSGTSVGEFAYVMKQDDESHTVYVVNSYAAKALLAKDMEYRDNSFLTVEDYTSEFRRVTVGCNDETVFDVYQFTQAEISADEDIWYSWYLYAPVEYGADSAALDTYFFQYFGTITAKSVVEDAPEDLARYGLDPSVDGAKVWTVTILMQDDSTVKLTLSEPVEIDGTSYRYGMVAGVNSVCLFSADDFTYLTEENWLRYKYKMAWTYNLFDVATVELTMDGSYHIMEVDAPTNEEKETKAFTGSFDGAELTENNGRQLYALIMGTTFYDSTSEEPEHEAAANMTIRMTLKTGKSETVDFYAMNSRQFAVYKNGEYTGSYVNVNALDDIRTAVEKILTGDKVTEF